MRREFADSLRKGISGTEPSLSAVPVFRKICLFATLTLLSACNSIEPTYNEFFGEEPMPERVQVDAQELEGGSTPNLSTVPMERPTPTPAQERESIRRSLQEDHSRSGSRRERADDSGETSKGPAEGEDHSSYLNRPSQSKMAAAGRSDGPVFVGVQLAQVTINEDVISDGVPSDRPFSSHGNSDFAGVIYFKHGSNALDERDRDIITEIVRVAEREGAGIQVVGHASAHTLTMDQERFERVNQTMSRQRAEAVARAFRQAGLADGRIQIVARGASDRVYAEFMPTGEAGNRRVEIFLLY